LPNRPVVPCPVGYRLKLYQNLNTRIVKIFARIGLNSLNFLRGQVSGRLGIPPPIGLDAGKSRIPTQLCQNPRARRRGAEPLPAQDAAAGWYPAGHPCTMHGCAGNEAILQAAIIVSGLQHCALISRVLFPAASAAVYRLVAGRGERVASTLQGKMGMGVGATLLFSRQFRRLDSP
jgi:hypothetical protein